MKSKRNPSQAQTLKAGIAVSLLIAGLGCGTSASRFSASGKTGETSPANQAVSGPQLGYVWDPTVRAVRTVVGVSASASLGGALYTGLYQAAYISQLRSYALLTGMAGEIDLVTLPGGEPRRVSNRLSSQQQVALSPTGNQAIVYAPDLASLTWIQGLPNNPTLQTVSLPSSTTVSLAVVSDTGLALIAGTQADGSSRLQSVTQTGATATVLSVGQLGGLAFLPRSTNALIADAAQNRVLLASGLDGAATISQVAGAADGIAQPAALAATADGRWAVVANRQNPTISRIDLTHQAPIAQVRCTCSPTILLPLAGNSIFLVTPLDAAALSLFKEDGAKPLLFFLAGSMPGVRP